MSGYKLVPIEPIDEMVFRGAEAIHDGLMRLGIFPNSYNELVKSQITASVAEDVIKAGIHAAPVVEQEPVAWVSPSGLRRLSHDSPVNYALVHKRSNNETLPLYLHPQPVPDFSDAYEGAREDLLVWKRRAQKAEKNADQLLEALTPNILDWIKCGLSVNGLLVGGDHPAYAKLSDAIRACRKDDTFAKKADSGDVK